MTLAYIHSNKESTMVRAMKTVKYPVHNYTTQEVTVAEYDLVWHLFNPSNGGAAQKVLAIKFIRQQYGLGLKEAKDICDAIGAEERDNRW